MGGRIAARALCCLALELVLATTLRLDLGQLVAGLRSILLGFGIVDSQVPFGGCLPTVSARGSASTARPRDAAVLLESPASPMDESYLLASSTNANTVSVPPIENKNAATFSALLFCGPRLRWLGSFADLSM